MSMTLTLSLLAGALIVALFAGWRGARPSDFLKPRMVPWRFIMLLAGALAFLLVIHVGTLLGVPQRGA
jgi:O-antigen ligase